MSKLAETLMHLRNEAFIREQLGADPSTPLQAIKEQYQKRHARDPIATHIDLTTGNGYRKLPFVRGPHYDKGRK